MRNRKHLRKFKPVVSEPNNPLLHGPAPVSIPREVLPEGDLGKDSAADPGSGPIELPQMMYRNEVEVRNEVAPAAPNTPPRTVSGQCSYSPPPGRIPAHQSAPYQQVPHVLPTASDDSSPIGLRHSAWTTKRSDYKV